MTAKFSKLVWIKALTKAVDMNVTTKMVGVALSNYSNGKGESAHPGTKRLADDLQVTTKTIERQLVILRSKGWAVIIRKSTYAGLRAWADVYKLSIPDQQTPVSVSRDGEGGDIWGIKPTDQQTSVADRQTFEPDQQTPVSDHQIFTHQSFSHHSESVDSGSLSRASEQQKNPFIETRRTLPENWRDDDQFDAVAEWIDEQVGGLHDIEESTCFGMLSAGAHPNAVVRTILKRRKEGISA